MASTQNQSLQNHSLQNQWGARWGPRGGPQPPQTQWGATVRSRLLRYACLGTLLENEEERMPFVQEAGLEVRR